MLKRLKPAAENRVDIRLDLRPSIVSCNEYAPPV